MESATRTVESSTGADKVKGKEQARQLLNAGQAGEAADGLRTVLDANPGDAEAHALLASALSVSGDGEGSRQHFEEACRLDPGRAAEGLGRLRASAAPGSPTAPASTPAFNALTFTAPTYPEAGPSAAVSPLPLTEAPPPFPAAPPPFSPAAPAVSYSPVPAADRPPPELVSDIGGVRAAYDPPDIVHWLGMAYGLLAGVSALLVLLNLVALLTAMGHTTSTVMSHIWSELGLTVVLLGAGFALFRGFQAGAKLAWYGQIVVCVLSFLGLPFVVGDTYMLLFPIGGGLILYHWLQPAIKEWFEIG